MERPSAGTVETDRKTGGSYGEWSANDWNRLPGDVRPANLHDAFGQHNTDAARNDVSVCN